MTALPMDPTAMTLFGDDYALPSADYDVLDPDRIHADRVPMSTIVDFQAAMSSAIWRPGPGRNVGFMVRHGDDLLGLMVLAGGVINLGARDRFLELPADPVERGRALRHYADLSVCIPIQPAGWRWNLGKLIASIAYTMGDAWHGAFGDELRGVTTMSINGRPSQYDRVYRFLGLTKGFGHAHVTDDQYRAMMNRMRAANVEPIGTGTHGRYRMERIKAYIAWARDNDPDPIPVTTANHGQRRGIYYHDAVEPSMRADVIRSWFVRWGAPRYARTAGTTPPYTTGIAS